MSPLRRFAPPIALMGLIFGLSATPDLNSGLGTIDLVGRKVVHMTEYGLLWFLWHRAFGFRRPWVAAAIAVAYAGTDEYHQTFIQGRHGTPVDVAIDTAGVAVAWGLVRARAARPAS
jgi:VanZ family protein